MQVVKLILEGDGAFEDIRGREDVKQGVLTHVAYLAGGMQSGSPSVMMRGTLEDGSIVLLETSGKMFATLGVGIRAKCQKDGIDV